jgi:4-amino-4-deoxy-L-arabinose transferase-like glycosyltransferase
MLILLGLALGSDHISLGLIFLGGVLSAAALYQLARSWMSLEGSLAVTLVFLLTPMVFWQMTVAGAPDIWILFYCTVAVFAAARCVSRHSTNWAILAGFLAGAAGGSKYPAMIIPIALCVLLLLETRLFGITFASALAAVAAGVWPLLRNAWWTGDPVFPFLSRWLAPKIFNPYTFASVQADTHIAAGHGGFISWIEYPFRLVLEGQSYGVGHYFGPLVLVFAPLLFFCGKAHALVQGGFGRLGGGFPH